MFKFFKEMGELRERNLKIKAENEAKKEAQRLAEQKELEAKQQKLEDKRYQDELRSINFTSKLDKSNIQYHKLTDDEIQKYKDEIEYVMNNVKHQDATTTKVLVTAYKHYDLDAYANTVQRVNLNTEIIYRSSFVDHINSVVTPSTLYFTVKYNNITYASNVATDPLDIVYYDYNKAFVSKMGFETVEQYIIHLMMLYCPAMIFKVDDSSHSVDTILTAFKTYGKEYLFTKSYSHTRTDITENECFRQSVFSKAVK
jgi:hypothetical protein